MYWVYDDWGPFPRIFMVGEKELRGYWHHYDYNHFIVFQAELVME